MGIAQWAGVLDAVGGFVQVARRFRQTSSDVAPATASPSGPVAGLGFVEARLAGVMVAALKEAFDRDSARMEMERSQIDAERRRAEERAARGAPAPGGGPDARVSFDSSPSWRS